MLNSLAHPAQGQSSLLYDPPYTHQATALEATIRDGKSLVVTTGTGSGKTESFLLPILGKLGDRGSGQARIVPSPGCAGTAALSHERPGK